MFQIGFCICHMETVSIYYPSMCQTLCEGAAVHRRPANWFDTGEKWCMIALAGLSLSGCQMALAWGHYKHIRPWFLHSQGVSPQCKYLSLACFPCVDGRPPWPRSLFQQNNKETWRGNRTPFRSLLRGGCQSFISSANGEQTDWETITTLRRSAGEEGMSRSCENDLCPNLLRSGHMGLRGCNAACLYTFCWENDIQSGKASMNKTS